MWDKVKIGPKLGVRATSPLLSGGGGGSPMLLSMEQNDKMPIDGQMGYITPSVWGSLTLQRVGLNQRWAINGRMGYITRFIWGLPNA